GQWGLDVWPAYGPVNFQYSTSLAIGWWKFDETSGTVAADSSGTGNTGTAANPVWLPTGGHTGGALSCNGNTVVTLPNNLVESPDSSTLTVAAWIKTGASGVIMAAESTPFGGTPGYYEPLLYVGLDGRARGAVWPGSPLASAAAINDNAWHHMALVVGSAGQTLYVDGAPVATNGWAQQPIGHVYNQLCAGYN